MKGTNTSNSWRRWNNFGTTHFGKMGRKTSILALISVSLLIFACNDAFAWGSVRSNDVDLLDFMIGPSHDYILRQAYMNLKQDPAWSEEDFPKFPKIYDNEGQDIDKNGKSSGSGPDSGTQGTAYSWHEYNPSYDGGAGKAPEQTAYWFKNLKKNIEDKEMEAAAKGAAYLAHYVADVTCPYHVNGMPKKEADGLSKTGKLSLSSNIVGVPLPKSNIGMGRDRVPLGNERLVYCFPAGAPVRGSGGNDNSNWSREYNEWLKLDNDWFDPWYNDGTSIYNYGVGILSKDYHMPEASSTHALWEWYAYNNYSRPNYPETNVEYSSEYLKLQNENVADDKIEKFVKTIAEKTRKNQEAILKESATYDTKRDIHSELGTAYQEAIADVYTLWRASFSALKPNVEFKLGSESGHQKICVTIDNKAKEDAKNIDITVKAVGGDNTKRPYVIQSDKEIPKKILAGKSITVEDKWELDLPSDLSETLYLIVEVTGKFERTPDLGNAVLKKEIPVAPRGGWVLEEKKIDVLKNCGVDVSWGNLKAHDCSLEVKDNYVAGKVYEKDVNECEIRYNSKVSWTEPPSIITGNEIEVILQAEMDGSQPCELASADDIGAAVITAYNEWGGRTNSEDFIELEWHYGEPKPSPIQKKIVIRVVPGREANQKFFVCVAVGIHGVDPYHEKICTGAYGGV